MGNCIYCGKKAGFWKSVHPECQLEQEKKKELLDKACQSALALAMRAAKGDIDSTNIKEQLQEMASASSFSPTLLKGIAVLAWEKTLEEYLEEKVFTAQEENDLMKYAHFLDLGQEDLNKNGGVFRATQAAILRDLSEGKTPNRMHLSGNLPFVLQKGETIIWYQKDCTYMEEKTFRSYVGGSAGMSVRIMKGVYYRTSAFKGHPVETSKVVPIDRGTVAITTKNIYFAGARKSYRIPFAKIVSLSPYSDGFGVFKEAANSKQQIFITGNGWFFGNLLANFCAQAQAQ